MQLFQDYDGSLERLAKESDCLKQAYGHFFDLTIVNNDIDETIRFVLEWSGVEIIICCPGYWSELWRKLTALLSGFPSVGFTDQ